MFYGEAKGRLPANCIVLEDVLTHVGTVESSCHARVLPAITAYVTARVKSFAVLICSATARGIR